MVAASLNWRLRANSAWPLQPFSLFDRSASARFRRAAAPCAAVVPRHGGGDSRIGFRISLRQYGDSLTGVRLLESSLYLPVKRFLEGRGFVVKGEVGGCDLVALKEGEAPLVVVGELKLSFNLELVLQAVNRASSSDEVWIAARLSARGKGRENDARFRNLCRRLGFGMLGVSPSGDVSIIVTSNFANASQGCSAQVAAHWRASRTNRRSRCQRRYAPADHDRLSPARSRLRRRNRQWRDPAAGS